MSPAIGPARFEDRLARTQAAVAERGLAALLVGVGPDLEWLTGYAAHGLERLTLLVVAAGGPITLIGPRLEAAAARAAPGLSGGSVTLRTWEDGEDPLALVMASLSDQRIGRPVEVSDGLRAAFVLGLQRVLPGIAFGVASATLSPLRRIKEADEVELLRAAARAADRVVGAIARGPLVGRSEAEVAREVRERLVDEGHDTAEFAIVASGPNSASPHHEPGARTIDPGEPLLFDIGGRREGYWSDITRTIWVAGEGAGVVEDTFANVYAIVERAAAAGRAAVRPGSSFGSIDAAARDVVAAAGLGEQFFHRLGHGIGLEVHEQPWVVAGNDELAAAGNTFSVEPGVYLEGRFGVRIEDAVACTEAGVDVLNEAPRELMVARGT